MSSPTSRIQVRARGFPDGPQPTPEAPCSLCGWNGFVTWFFQRPSWRPFDKKIEREQIWTPEPGCAYCALRLSIAQILAPEHGSTDMAIGHTTKQGRVVLSPVEGSSIAVPMAMYDLFVSEDETMLEGHEAQMKPVKRKITIGTPTSSQGSFDFIQQRLKECNKNHPTICGRPSGSTFAPTRLVDVVPINDAGDIYLAISKDVFTTEQETRPQPYAALSYCWGKTIPGCMLLSSTLESLKSRIPWDSMPKTLQDAVVCTRRLGLRYLWIDAVCIIQDSSSDWAKEAALMSDVYQNSYVTLAGLHSSESTQGLFTVAGEKNKGQVKLLDLDLDDRVYGIYMLDSQAHPDLDISDDAELAPLMRRGWCFQERILSPRVVFFGTDELLWECNASSLCQCLELNYRRAQRPPLKQRLAAQRQQDTGTVGSDHSTVNEQRDDWRSIVSAYTSTKLTKFKDRLIAINGLAKLFFQTRKQREGDEYLAGLWLSSVVQDLAWSARNFSWPLDLDALPDQAVYEADAQFIAPTWSWASAPGHVTWWNGMGDVDDFVFVPTVSVTRSNMSYLNQDPFGLALSGHLEMCAHLIPCVLSRLQWQSCDLHMLGCRLLVDLDLDDRPRHHWEGLLEREVVEMRPDEKFWRFQNIFLIPLGRRTPGHFTKRGLESDDITAILCRSVTDTVDNIRLPAFKRLGLVTITMEYNEVPEPLQFIFSEHGRKSVVLL